MAEADLAGLLLERFHANIMVAGAAMEAAAGEMTVEGQKGNPAAHPGFAIAAKCDEIALRLAVELGRQGAKPLAPPAPSEHLNRSGTLDAIARRRQARLAAEGEGSDAA